MDPGNLYEERVRRLDRSRVPAGASTRLMNSVLRAVRIGKAIGGLR